MKFKFFPFFLSLIFVLIFIVFYKGLNKSNIYAPDNIIEKKVPSFSGKLFNQEKLFVLERPEMAKISTTLSKKFKSFFL